MIPVLIKIKKWYSIIDFIIKMLYNIIGGDKMKLFKRENYLSKMLLLGLFEIGPQIIPIGDRGSNNQTFT